MSNRAISVYAEALKRKKQEETKRASLGKPARKPAPKVARKPAQERDTSRDEARKNARENARDSSPDRPREESRGKRRSLPTRDEIQEFSFRLRDDLKVKVQAEVPHQWQTDLEGIARELDVKKLELYRFILGEFLGKVRRKSAV